MLERTVKFDNENSWEDFGIVFESLTIGEAEPQLVLIDVPFRNGSLDESDYFGDIRYKDRTITMNFLIPWETDDQHSVYSKVQNKLNGQRKKITFSADEDWYYEGRLKVGDFKVENGFFKFPITATVEPYKYRDTSIVATGVNEVETLSGPLVTFDDGSGDSFNSLVANIKSVDYYNGYDEPWIGGAGTNLCFPIMHGSDGSVISTYTSNGLTYTMNNNGSVTISGTATAESLSGYAPSVTTLAPIPFLKEETYILSGSAGDNNSRLYAQFRDKNNNTVQIRVNGSLVNTVTCYGNETATFTVETPCCAYVRADIMSGTTVNATFYPMIRYASIADNTYLPYENIGNIRGFTNVRIITDNRNVISLPSTGISRTNNCSFERSKTEGSAHVMGTTGASAEFSNFNMAAWTVIVPKNVRLKISGGSGNAGVRICYYTYRGLTTSLSTAYNGVAYVTVPDSAVCSWIRIIARANSTINNTTYPLVTVDSDDGTEFTLPNRTVHSFSLGNAGTVYRGFLNATTGVLSVTALGRVFDGTESWTRIGSAPYLYRYVNSEAVTDSTQSKVVRACTHFSNGNVGTTSTALNLYGVYTSSGQTNTYVQFKPDTELIGGDTVEAWKAWLADQNAKGTPVTCWWAISTPITYQLPAHDIRTLVGTNNIWADSGDVELSYTKPIIVNLRNDHLKTFPVISSNIPIKLGFKNNLYNFSAGSHQHSSFILDEGDNEVMILSDSTTATFGSVVEFKYREGRL